MLPSDEFEFTGKVELFPQKGGWYFVRVPKIYTDISKDFADRGLVPIIATCNNTSWKTSLLPMGDGTHFIALNAKVRKENNLSLKDSVTVKFKFNI